MSRYGFDHKTKSESQLKANLIHANMFHSGTKFA